VLRGVVGAIRDAPVGIEGAQQRRVYVIEPEKAYKSFQIVCSLDEGHIDAARMMYLIERRQQSGSRGLFDRLRRK
jgi:hypothetical protein